MKHTIFEVTKYAGQYRMDAQLAFMLAKKPNWLHRTMVRLLLGWKWLDIKDVQ